MEAAHRATRVVPSDVRLRHLESNAGGGQLVTAEGAREEATLVVLRLEVDEEGARHRSGADLHAGGSTTSSCGTATTKRPPHSPTARICPTISSRRFQGRIST